MSTYEEIMSTTPLGDGAPKDNVSVEQEATATVDNRVSSGNTAAVSAPNEGGTPNNEGGDTGGTTVVSAPNEGGEPNNEGGSTGGTAVVSGEEEVSNNGDDGAVVKQEDEKKDEIKPVSVVDAANVSDVKHPERLSYSDMYERMNPEPKVDEAKEKKKQRREMIIAAISDGLTAISDMIFASKGAKGVLAGGMSQTKAAKERWDKVKEEREKNKKAWEEGYFKSKNKDDEWEKWKAEQARKKEEDERKKRADERAEESHRAGLENTKAHTDYYKAQTAGAEEKAKTTAEVQQSVIDKNKSAVNANNALAEKRRGEAGDNGKYVFNGKDYGSAQAYKTAVQTAVRRWNQSHPDKQIALDKEIVTQSGHKTSRKRAERKTEDIASELVLAQEQEENSGGSSEIDSYKRGGKKGVSTTTGTKPKGQTKAPLD